MAIPQKKEQSWPKRVFRLTQTQTEYYRQCADFWKVHLEQERDASEIIDILHTHAVHPLHDFFDELTHLFQKICYDVGMRSEEPLSHTWLRSLLQWDGESTSSLILATRAELKNVNIQLNAEGFKKGQWKWEDSFDPGPIALCWSDFQRDQFDAFFAKEHQGSFWELMPTLSESTTILLDGSMPIKPLCSKIGGAPDIPEGVQWPTSEQGTPLHFIAQFGLQDLHACFPSIFPNVPGVLSFFSEDGDPSKPTKSSVFFWFAAQSWKQPQLNNKSKSFWAFWSRTQSPSQWSSTSPAQHKSPTHPEGVRVRLRKTWDLPPHNTRQQIDSGENIVPLESRRFLGTFWKLRKRHSWMGGSSMQLLGYPRSEQPVVSNDKGKVWRPLFQFHTEQTHHFTPGEGFSYTFWIEEGRLKAKDFRGVWLTAQL